MFLCQRMVLIESTKMSDEKISAWNIYAAQEVRSLLAKYVYLEKDSLGVLGKQTELTLNNPFYHSTFISHTFRCPGCSQSFLPNPFINCFYC